MAKRDRRRRSFGSWWRHRAPRLLIAGDGALALIYAVPHLVPRVLGLAALGLVIAGEVGARLHGRRRYWWCERCLEEAGPSADLEERASRRQFALFAAHFGGTLPFQLCLAYCLALGSLLPWHTGDVLMATLAALLAAQWLAVDVHQRLALYCPICRRGGGGGDDEEEPEPVPDPDPAGGREHVHS